MASISPHNAILGFRKAKHLLRRATFSYSKEQLDLLADLTAVQAVESLLDASENVSFYTHVQIPVYQRVNEVNLVPSFGVLAGVSYGF